MKDLSNIHPLYKANSPMMQRLQSAYLADDTFKFNTRSKRQTEDPKFHANLVNNTTVYPVCRYVIESVNEQIFETGVDRTLTFATSNKTEATEDQLGWVELMLMDADLTNKTFTQFMEGVAELSSIFGHCWVAVDMPKNGGNRPYCVTVNPLLVEDWEYENHNGKEILCYAKIAQGTEGDCRYYKTLHLGDTQNPSYWQEWEYNTITQEAKLLDSGTYPEGMILPFFLAIGKPDPRTKQLGTSEIQVAADAQRELFILETEAMLSLILAATLIRADEGINIPAFKGGIARGTQGSVESISIDTGDVVNVMAKQDKILEHVEALTGLSGLRQSSLQVQSGVSIVEQRKTIHRKCRAKARQLEIVEEQIFSLAARFMNQLYAGNIEYNTDYEATDTQYRIALMNQAKNLAGENEMIRDLLVAEAMKLLAPKESKKEYREAIKPLLIPQVQTLLTTVDDRLVIKDTSVLPEAEPEEDDEMDNEMDDEMESNSVIPEPILSMTPEESLARNRIR